MFRASAMPLQNQTCAPTRVHIHPWIWTPQLMPRWVCKAYVDMCPPDDMESLSWKRNNIANGQSVILSIKIHFKVYKMSLTYCSALSWHWEGSASCMLSVHRCSATPWSQCMFHTTEVTSKHDLYARRYTFKHPDVIRTHGSTPGLELWTLHCVSQ